MVDGAAAADNELGTERVGLLARPPPGKGVEASRRAGGSAADRSRACVHAQEERCWRKISTSRQAHSKLNKAGLIHVSDLKRASQFSWNWQRMKNG
jgi:hypothetical protein